MKHKFKLVLGDWSGDGHREYVNRVIECNHDVKTMQEAYKASCKKFGFSFNHNDDFTGIERDYMEAKKYQVCSEYEDNKVSEEVLQILDANNCPWRDLIDEKPPEDISEGATIYLDGFVKLLMWFISQSLDEKLEWKESSDEIPVLNGYWDENLNIQFAYGLFS